MAYLNMIININELLFNRPGNLLPLIYAPFCFWTHFGLVGDNAWLIEVYKWNVCCIVPSALFTELCIFKQFYWELNWFNLSAEPLFGSDFVSSSRTNSDTFLFFNNVWTTNAMMSTADFTIIHPLCLSTSNPWSQTTHK